MRAEYLEGGFAGHPGSEGALRHGCGQPLAGREGVMLAVNTFRTDDNATA